MTTKSMIETIKRRMKNWISKKIDIEIYSDFSFAKHIRVLFMGKQIAHFMIGEGSTEIKRVNIEKVANSRVLTTF